MMLSSCRALFAAAVLCLAAGCGGDSKPTAAQPSGLSAEKAIVAGTASAAKSALLGYAQKRQGEISARLAELIPPPAPPPPEFPWGESGPGAGPGTAPGRKPSAPSGPAPDPILALPAEKQREIAEAQERLAKWGALVQALKGPAPDSCFKVQEHKVSNEKAEEATSRLVLSLAAGFQYLADGDLVFDLTWRRVVTTLYKSKPKADWLLCGSQLVSGGKEKASGD